MLVDIYNREGQQAGQIDLQDEVFSIEPNESAMHQAVVAYLTNKRQGTRKTKLRSEVRGGGRKPWRQKGRGTARAGSIRSPLWVGGGTIHGPKPHIYKMKLPKKLRRLAKKSALSLRASEQNLMVVEDFTFEAPRTKEMASIIRNLKVDNDKTLVLLPNADQNVLLSSRNLKNVTVQAAEKISAYDILSHKKLLIFKGAVDNIQSTFNNK